MSLRSHPRRASGWSTSEISWDRANRARVQKGLRKRELLHVAIDAADHILRGGARPSQRLFDRAQRAAEKAIMVADPFAGTSTHRFGVRYSHGVYSLARRAVLLARRLNWSLGPAPAWESRIGRYELPGLAYGPGESRGRCVMHEDCRLHPEIGKACAGKTYYGERDARRGKSVRELGPWNTDVPKGSPSAMKSRRR